jgi:VWFA-related protein
MTRLTSILLLAVAACANAGGQCPANLARDRALTIPVSVIDKERQAIDNLQTSNFEVTLGGVPQTICGVLHTQNPISLGILFDTSASMQGQNSDLFKETRSAIEHFLDSAKPAPANEYMLQYVNEHPIPAEFTSDIAQIRAGLASKAKGKTALIDALYLALKTMQKAHNVDRALLILSDGIDNSSRHHIRELEELFQQRPVPIFFVVPVDVWSRRFAMSPDEEDTRADILRFVNKSGGYSVAAGTKELDDEMRKLAPTILSPYLVLLPSGAAVITPGTELHVKVVGISPAPIALFRGIQVVRSNWR